MTRQERKVLEQALGAMNECLFDEQWYAAKDALKDALEAHKALSAEHVAQPEQEPVALETVYETIIQWDEGGGKRSRRELARRIVTLYTNPPQPEHDLYTDADKDKPDAICDRNGQVALAMCKKCGKAEIELDEPCVKPQPEQEPVAWIEHHKGGDNLNWEEVNHPYAKATPLYTTPPQRTWAWLTAEQKVALCKKFPDHLTFNAIEAIEAQLKQNNGFA